MLLCVFHSKFKVITNFKFYFHCRSSSGKQFQKGQNWLRRPLKTPNGYPGERERGRNGECERKTKPL